MLYTASKEDIMKGRVTDVYFERTEQILRARGLNRDVRTEIVAKGLARDWEWAIFYKSWKRSGGNSTCEARTM